MATVKESGIPLFTPPGISFTAPEKSRPWQQPPKLPNLKDVVAFYMSSLSDKGSVDSLLDSLETGVSLSSIAESLMLGSVSQGIHTIDAGILVMPVIIEMLITAAEVNDIDYVVYDTDIADDKLPARAVREAAKLAVKSLSNTEEEVPDQEEMKLPAGLMSKKNVEV